MRLALAFIMLLLLALAAQLPLALAARQVPGLGAAAAIGSVWGGRLQGADVGGVAIGDIGVALAPLPLLLGRRQVALEGAGWRAGLQRGGAGDWRLVGVDGRLSLPPGQPLTAMALAGVDVEFVGGRCRQARGGVTAWTAALAEPLAGAATCDGGALRLALAGGGASLDLRITGDGAWRGSLANGSSTQALSGRIGA